MPESDQIEGNQSKARKSRKFQGASLKDVAELAGVSVKTVSNVVNNYPHVTEKTRLRVQRALEELNYRPNLSARNLRNGKSGLIALAVPEIDFPYFSELARLVIKVAEERGYTVLIDQTGGARDREKLVLAGIRPQMVDGIIFSPIETGKEDLLERRDTTPLVLLGEGATDGILDHVGIDNVKAARVAVQHLLDLGRRRIAAIGAQPGVVVQTGHLRLRGYCEALQEAGIEIDQDLIARAPAYHRHEGAEAMRKLLELKDPPDAVFCFNDLLALGAIRTLINFGLRVPEDVAVVGFDDIEEASYSNPTLTSISPNKEQIARIAMSMLISRMEEGTTTPPREEQVDFRLIARESTLGVRCQEQVVYDSLQEDKARNNSALMEG